MSMTILVTVNTLYIPCSTRQTLITFYFLGEKKRQAFLDLLIESAENGVVLTDKEVREQVDTIMFEVSMQQAIWIYNKCKN